MIVRLPFLSLLSSLLGLFVGAFLFSILLQNLSPNLWSSLMVVVLSAGGGIFMVVIFSRWSKEEGFIAGTMIASLIALVISGAFFAPLVGPLGWLLVIALQPVLASWFIPRCPSSWPLPLVLSLFFSLPFLLPLSYYW